MGCLNSKHQENTNMDLEKAPPETDQAHKGEVLESNNGNGDVSKLSNSKLDDNSKLKKKKKVTKKKQGKNKFLIFQNISRF